MKVIPVTASFVLLLSGLLATAIAPVPDEMADMSAWVDTHFAGKATEFPFSFTYDGQPFSNLRARWTVTESVTQEEPNRAQRSIVWTDPTTGLEVRLNVIVYSDYPAVEWVAFYKNTGQQNSGILENVRGLDTLLPHDARVPVVVHHGNGSMAKITDFAPSSDALPSGGHLELASHGGGGHRGGGSSVESLPFFEIDAETHGSIFGIGWTAPWAMQVSRDEKGTVLVQAGLEKVHLRLLPGEEVRGPSILTLFWKGDPLRGRNLWRRLLMEHYSPRPGGKPFAGLIADGNWGSWMSATRHIEEIRWWRDHDLPMECYWVDAGWTDMSLGWEAHQSHQVPNSALFPEGMKPLSEAAHERGMKFLLWMVPGSAHPAVGVGKEHPEWLGEAYRGKEYGSMVFYGLDLGNPDVNRYMIDHFSKVVDDFGVDVFRQDGGNLWNEDRDADRVGANEMRYVQGAYAFWDGLLKSHPGILIDNCAEGGRKVDIETIRRSIVLWRSDFQASGDFDPVSTQGFTYGLLQWIPLCGGVAPVHTLSAYAFRSAYCPAILMGWPMKSVADLKERWNSVNLDLLRRLLKEYVAVRPYVFGDFYPLTPYSIEAKDWLAWQFDRPDLGEGMLQVFRRAGCDSAEQTYALHGLDADATYTVMNLDETQSREMNGQTLMESGINVTVPDKPGAAVVTYKRVK